MANTKTHQSPRQKISVREKKTDENITAANEI